MIKSSGSGGRSVGVVVARIGFNVTAQSECHLKRSADAWNWLKAYLGRLRAYWGRFKAYRGRLRTY